MRLLERTRTGWLDVCDELYAQAAKGAILTQQLQYIPAWNDLHAYSTGETNALILPVYKRLSFSVAAGYLPE